MDLFLHIAHHDVTTVALYTVFSALVLEQMLSAMRDGGGLSAVVGCMLSLIAVFILCATTGYMADHEQGFVHTLWWKPYAHTLLNLCVLVLIGFTYKSRAFYEAFSAEARAVRARRESVVGQTVLEHLPAIAYGFCAPDESGAARVTFSMGAGLEQVGWARDEAVGGDILNDFGEETARMAQLTLDEGRSAWMGEYSGPRQPRPQQIYTTCRLIGKELADGTAAMCVALNVTEATEEIVRRAEQQHAAAIEHERRVAEAERAAAVAAAEMRTTQRNLEKRVRGAGGSDGR